MKRREFLGSAALATATRGSTSSMAPRKVIVGTLMQSFWVAHPGLEKRLEELTGAVDRMDAEARRKYGRGVDLAVLPEASVTGETGRETRAKSVPYEGPVAKAFGGKARERGCYIVAATYLREAEDRGKCSNAALLVGRKGELVGTYRKMHVVPSADGRVMEGGVTAGREVPVFDCDFGKLGMQICYDMEFDLGWKELGSKGAELVAWPTQSPQTSQPAARAMEQRCFIVSSTWRHNASVFEPTGKIVAQVRGTEGIAVKEIDLSYAILPWSAQLKRGKLFDEKYGSRAGYRYYEEEDLGIFWSNDARLPVRKMVEELGLREADEQLEWVRGTYRRAGMRGY